MTTAPRIITPERTEAHYFLRMRETDRSEPRQAVLDRLGGYATAAGLEPTAVAGLYDLQAQLGRLISSSLVEGIGGLLALFYYALAHNLKEKCLVALQSLKAFAYTRDINFLKPFGPREPLRFPYAAAIAFGFSAYVNWGGLL